MFASLRNGSRLNRESSLLVGIIASDGYNRHLLIRPLLFMREVAGPTASEAKLASVGIELRAT